MPGAAPLDAIIHRERYEAATVARVREARRRWEARARAAARVRLVQRRRPLLKEFERVLLEAPWYLKVLYVRRRRLATLLIIALELLRRVRVRLRVAPLLLGLASRLVWRYRLSVWGEAEWKAYHMTLIRFYAELYQRIVERILATEEARVLPLARVYFSGAWGYFEHEWLSETLARLAPPHQALLVNALRTILKRGLAWEEIERLYPDVAALLLYLGYRELGLGYTRAEVLLIPKFFEDAFGGLGVAFYAVYIPRKYAEPDPYIGATSPPPVQHLDYAWKDELEEVPVKTPYYAPEELPLLFDALGGVFYADDWRVRVSGTLFEEAMVLGSHGIWERVGLSVARGFFGTVGRTRADFIFRRRGAYYLVRTVLHHLGLR